MEVLHQETARFGQHIDFPEKNKQGLACVS